jgi:hypothetical protein
MQPNWNKKSVLKDYFKNECQLGEICPSAMGLPDIADLEAAGSAGYPKMSRGFLTLHVVVKKMINVVLLVKKMVIMEFGYCAHILVRGVIIMQTLVLSGVAAPVGQLPMVPATITALSGSKIVVNSTHVSGGITLEEGARYKNSPCGDDVVDDWRGEECDTGSENADGPDAACRIECTLPCCGDDIHDSGEGCDGGSDNADVPDAACRTDCTLPRCGDGIHDSGEGCDGDSDNADVPDAACRTDCTVARCGDGVQDSAEGCNGGSANADVPDTACRTDCTVARCGDGVQDSAEGCDEGEANSADGSCGVDR